MSEAIKDYTSSGKIKRPSYSLVVRWVKEGWDAIDINMIRQCCGVSNTMDGTEDTLIFDFDRLEYRVKREDPRSEVEGERNENNSEESDSEESDLEKSNPDYNKSESKECDESEIEDSDESESGDSIESESEDSNESETEENYYKKNEEQIVIQDWK
ncbi:unnamed protein product [Rhizophagus irregularis]|nr:unnamed protein product [Rhizophagus irregularis]